MTDLKIFNYNDNSIEFEVINGQVFANATIMCQAFGKRPNDFLNLISTKNYVEAVTKKTGNANLIQIRQGGFNQGTWIHEKLILKLSQWLDVDFEVWCDEKVAELLRTGKVEIQPKELSRKELAQMIIQVEEEKEVLQLQKQKLEVEVKTLENKTEYTEKVLNVTDTLLATEVCKEFGFKSANALNKELVEKGIIYKVRDHFVMTAKYAGKGYEKYSEYCYNSKVNGTSKISRQMEWTQLGRAFLHRLFNKDLSYSKSYTYPTIQIGATA